MCARSGGHTAVDEKGGKTYLNRDAGGRVRSRERAGGPKRKIRKAAEETAMSSSTTTTTTGYLGRDSSSPASRRQGSFSLTFFDGPANGKTSRDGKVLQCSVVLRFLRFILAKRGGRISAAPRRRLTLIADSFSFSFLFLFFPHMFSATLPLLQI
jgi:hypothetical protein